MKVERRGRQIKKERNEKRKEERKRMKGRYIEVETRNDAKSNTRINYNKSR